jgi:hypothetical protein
MAASASAIERTAEAAICPTGSGVAAAASAEAGELDLQDLPQSLDSLEAERLRQGTAADSAGRVLPALSHQTGGARQALADLHLP